MFTVFLFTAVIGWIFVAVFLFSAGDFDLDLDVDADLDLNADGGSAASSAGLEILGAIFSFRSIVFFAAFFGLTGLLLSWLDAGTILAVLIAIGIGLFAAFVNVKLMQYLQRTSINSQLKDTNIAGNAARVIVPIAEGSRGKVSVDVNGQRLYLIATPYNKKHDHEFAVGDTVVIVEVKNGSALVTSMDELD
jgi:membrane protein implicated in regulation of membrane protease activity